MFGSSGETIALNFEADQICKHQIGDWFNETQTQFLWTYTN